MKVIAVVFALFLAGVSAMPNNQYSEIESAIRSGEPRIVTGSIVQAIEDAAQAIVDAGLDPFHYEGYELDYAVPVPSVFNAHARVRNVNSRGLSNIVVNSINYSVLTNRLTFNIEAPGVSASLSDSVWDVNILSGKLHGEFSGSVAVRHVVIDGNIRIGIGVISGITIRDLAIKFSLAAIDSHLHLNLQGVDLSAPLNKHLGESVPAALKLYQNDIDLLISHYVRELAESVL